MLTRLFWGAGRLDRRLYGTCFIILVVGSWIAHAVGLAAVLSSALPATFVAPAILLFEATTTWVLVCIASQRLHDFGRSGWWQALPIALTCGAFALAEPAWAAALGLSDTAAGVSGIVGALVYIGFLLVIAIPRGSPDSNRFGEPA